jgi:hypothetical protein
MGAHEQTRVLPAMPATKTREGLCKGVWMAKAYASKCLQKETCSNSKIMQLCIIVHQYPHCCFVSCLVWLQCWMETRFILATVWVPCSMETRVTITGMARYNIS